MKTNHIISILLLGFIFLISCGGDETPEMVDDDPVSQTDDDPMQDPEPTPEEVLAQERTTNITALTADSEKVWRIESAQLTNIYGSFDISANFNIQDDEIIFKNAPLGSGKSLTEFEGTIEWRQNNDIDPFAQSVEGALLDSYVSPFSFAFDFKEESSTDLTAIDFDFTITSENNIQGILVLEEAADDMATLEVILVEKLESDYQQAPQEELQFSEVFTFSSNSVDSGAVGMAGSLATNAFFVALRDILPDGSANAERVIRFDLNTGQSNERYTNIPDFVSKQLIFQGGQLFVAGGQRINIYDLDLQNVPVSGMDYGTSLGGYLGLSRFGTAITDENIYLIGGDLDQDASAIYTYDIASDQTSFLTSMPAPRFGGRAEIVNNKLYVFGGTAEFFTPPSTDTIFIYDFDTGSFSTENMPSALTLSYTGKIENLIYVAGRIDVYDADGNRIDREPYLGVYDTRTGIFSELGTDLESPTNETIHSMAVFENKIYILYGKAQEFVEGQPPQTWSILAADI
jgi:hypothetical protein